MSSSSTPNKSKAPKSKAPLWPVYLAVVLLVLTAFVYLTDWRRYPSSEEISKYLKYSLPGTEKVVVIETIESDSSGNESMIYKLEIHKSTGEILKESYPIKHKDRNSVYPWADYYRVQNKINKNLNQ
ncbi:hypothetical protein OAB00_00230 [Akkermansiaceae bacterium]|nr:hypothetical protein [Akkermansiaceae bacterium]